MAGGGIESKSVAGVAAVEGVKTRFYLEGTGKKLKSIAPTAAAKKAAAAAKPAAAKIPASPSILMMLTSLLLANLLLLQEPKKKVKGSWREVPQGPARSGQQD